MNTVFSPDRRHRYTLWRCWDDGLMKLAPKPGYVNFCCCNPSTADETADDRTVAKLARMSKAWGYGAMCVTNAFAFRSTYPVDLQLCGDPVGPDNDKWTVEAAKGAALVVVAWGEHGLLAVPEPRWKAVVRLLSGIDLWCFGANNSGQPKHPLYVTESKPLVRWEAPAL